MSNPIVSKFKLYVKTLHWRIVFALIVFALAYGYRYYDSHGLPDFGFSSAAPEEPAPGTGGIQDLYAADNEQALKLLIELENQRIEKEKEQKNK